MLRESSRTWIALLRTQVHLPLSLVRFLALILSITLPGTVQAELSALTETLTLTERMAVADALVRPDWVEAETGRVAVAQSVVTEAGLLPNPVFAFSRDRLSLAGGDITERSVQVSQTFDFSGRRALRHEAATRRLDAERFDGRVRRLNTIADVRKAFAETLHHSQIQAALGLWLTRIEDASAVTAKLVKAGEVSGYDRRRIQRELLTVRARLAVAQANAARSRETLAALTGMRRDEVMRLLGDLLPDAAPALDVLQSELRQRADLASLLSQAEAFEREHHAAQRGWIPDLTVGLGQKMLDETTRSGSGSMVGVSFSIPLFDRGGAAQQRSLAQAQTLRAEHALLLTQADAELRNAWNQAEELRKATLTYRHDASDASHNLSRIAQAAYQAGEANLLELLDAYRTELDFATSELDIALGARLAYINLETLSGVSSYE